MRSADRTCSDAAARDSTTAVNEHTAEHIHTAGTTRNGLSAPAARRSAQTVVGITDMEDVLSTASVIMSSLAVPRGTPMPRARSSSFFIAARAYGVAALPIPRMLALMFAAISSTPQPERTASGNTTRKSGVIRRVRCLSTPAFLKSSIMPHHRHIVPHSVSVSFTAPEAPSSTAHESASARPVAIP